MNRYTAYPQRKRLSGTVKLTLLLAGGVAAYMVYDHSKTVKVDNFQTAESCIAAGPYTAADCEASMAEAKAIHEQARPQFVAKADCEKDYGQGKCEQTSSSMFGPLFWGYMIGRTLSGGGLMSQPVYNAGPRGMVTVGGNAMPANVDRMNRSSFADARNSTGAVYGAGRSSVTRGGFGSTGRAVGSTG